MPDHCKRLTGWNLFKNYGPWAVCRMGAVLVSDKAILYIESKKVLLYTKAIWPVKQHPLCCEEPLIYYFRFFHGSQWIYCFKIVNLIEKWDWIYLVLWINRIKCTFTFLISTLPLTPEKKCWYQEQPFNYWIFINV